MSEEFSIEIHDDLSSISGMAVKVDERGANEWISVDDELPKDGADCLVFANGVIGIAKRWEMIDKWLMFGWEGDIGNGISHWMPLPCPPKE